MRKITGRLSDLIEGFIHLAGGGRAVLLDLLIVSDVVIL